MAGRGVRQFTDTHTVFKASLNTPASYLETALQSVVELGVVSAPLLAARPIASGYLQWMALSGFLLIAPLLAGRDTRDLRGKGGDA
jgi:hypothetical protein